jgi:nitrogen fixation protein FixH
MNDQMEGAKKQREFTGRHMAIIMVAFFGVVVSVNGYMAWVAVDSWTGLMARNGYVASQDFNAGLAVRRKQDSLGYQSLLRYADDAMVFTFRDRSGQPLAGYKITLKLARPTNEREDRQFVMTEGMPGIYRQKLQLAPGQWNADVIASDQTGRRWKRLVRLYVKG